MRFNVYLNGKQNENNVGEILVITLIKKNPQIDQYDKFVDTRFEIIIGL